MSYIFNVIRSKIMNKLFVVIVVVGIDLIFVHFVNSSHELLQLFGIHYLVLYKGDNKM